MKWYLKVMKQYADFKGRARRKEYWMFTLFQCLFLFVAMMIDRLLHLSTDKNPYGPIYGLYALATIVPGIAVAVRRMHDVGKSGWYILIPIYSFILAVTEGEKGQNSYGPDPKEGETANG